MSPFNGRFAKIGGREEGFFCGYGGGDGDGGCRGDKSFFYQKRSLGRCFFPSLLLFFSTDAKFQFPFIGTTSTRTSSCCVRAVIVRVSFGLRISMLF